VVVSLHASFQLLPVVVRWQSTQKFNSASTRQTSTKSLGAVLWGSG